MKAMELIQTALQISDQGITRLVEDMRDAPLTFPTPRGGNHPLWVIRPRRLRRGQHPTYPFRRAKCAGPLDGAVCARHRAEGRRPLLSADR